MSKKLTDKDKHQKCIDVLEFMIENMKSLTHSLKVKGVSKTVFYNWKDSSEENKNHYARTREELIDLKFESIQEDYSEDPLLDPTTGKIDSGWVQLQRLKIDSKKWELSKLKPKKYGDSTTLKHEGGENPIETIQVFKLPDNKRD